MGTTGPHMQALVRLRRKVDGPLVLCSARQLLTFLSPAVGKLAPNTFIRFCPPRNVSLPAAQGPIQDFRETLKSAGLMQCDLSRPREGSAQRGLLLGRAASLLLVVLFAKERVLRARIPLIAFHVHFKNLRNLYFLGTSPSPSPLPPAP